MDVGRWGRRRRGRRARKAGRCGKDEGRGARARESRRLCLRLRLRLLGQRQHEGCLRRGAGGGLLVEDARGWGAPGWGEGDGGAGRGGEGAGVRAWLGGRVCVRSGCGCRCRCEAGGEEGDAGCAAGGSGEVCVYCVDGVDVGREDGGLCGQHGDYGVGVAGIREHVSC